MSDYVNRERAKHIPGFAYAFYTGEAWRTCRASYLKSRGGLCERCGKKGLAKPADQVHHKIRLTRENIGDPSITLSWDNLEALCEECHREEHHPVRWRVDPDGHVEL